MVTKFTKSGHSIGDLHQEINLSDISYVTMDDNGDTVIIVNTDHVLRLVE